MQSSVLLFKSLNQFYSWCSKWSYQEMTVKKNLLVQTPRELTRTIIKMNRGLLNFISFADHDGLFHVIKRPKKTGTTRRTRDIKSCRYGSEIFLSVFRTNLPNNQTQKVVVAKLATVLQNVIVTDKLRSPPHNAENMKVRIVKIIQKKFPLFPKNSNQTVNPVCATNKELQLISQFFV